MEGDWNYYTDKETKRTAKESCYQLETGDFDREYDRQRCDEYSKDCSHGMRQDLRLIEAIGLKKSCPGIDASVDLHRRHNWSSTSGVGQLAAYVCH